MFNALCKWGSHVLANNTACTVTYRIKIRLQTILEGGEYIVTVYSQVKQAVAGLKSAQASFEQFALQTQNQQAKQLYTDAANQTKTIVNSVEQRVQQLEQEEPQYKQS